MNIEDIKYIVLTKSYAELSSKEREVIRDEISNEEEYNLYKKMLSLLAEEDEELFPSPDIKGRLLEEFKQKRWLNNLENTNETPRKIVPLVQEKKKKRRAFIGWAAAVLIGFIAVSIYTKTHQYQPKTLAFAEVEIQEFVQEAPQPKQKNIHIKEEQNKSPQAEERLTEQYAEEQQPMEEPQEATTQIATVQPPQIESNWEEETQSIKSSKVQSEVPARAMMTEENNQLASVSMATHKELIQLLYTAL